MRLLKTLISTARHLLAGAGLCLCALALAAGEKEVQVTSVRIPVAVPATEKSAAHTAQLVGNVYRPEGAGPWGLMVLSHGTPGAADKRENMTDRYGPQAKALAGLGYVVVTALRRGYGASDGPLADQYGKCDAPDYVHAAQESARDVAAVLAYGKHLPQVDVRRVVLVGKSAGGFASLALAAQQPEGVRAVVNFSGGRGSQPQQRALGQICGQPQLLNAVAGFAITTQIPQLWVYAQNDQYFTPPLVKQMAAAYQQVGVPVQLEWMPLSGKDGHRFFDLPAHIPQWLPLVATFLQRQVSAPAP